jgi:hypothetical protein
MQTILKETSEFADRWQAALALLLEANDLAHDARRNDWEFAVEIADLEGVGLSKNAIRWLIHKGYARHAVETTRATGQGGRQFRFVDNLVFPSTSCLVLTEGGVRFARELRRGGQRAAAAPAAQATSATTAPPEAVPIWDARARVLRFDGRVVKHFKVPAGNQELVLCAFEEEGWPRTIDDPLPPAAGLDAKRRLHDTINRLNRNQKHRLIHFSGNGSGRAVCWASTGLGDCPTDTKAPPLRR